MSSGFSSSKNGRRKMNLLQKKSKPPFKVSIVHNSTLPFKPPSPLKTHTIRSNRLASNQAASSKFKKSNEADIREQSFAPMNAKFHLPKNIAGGTLLFGTSTAAVTRSKDTFVSHNKDISTRSGAANQLNCAYKTVASKLPNAPKPATIVAVSKTAPKLRGKAVTPPRKTITTRPKAFATKPEIAIPTINIIEADNSLPSDHTFYSSILACNSSTPDSSDADFYTPGNFVTVARWKGSHDENEGLAKLMSPMSTFDLAPPLTTHSHQP